MPLKSPVPSIKTSKPPATGFTSISCADFCVDTVLDASVIVILNCIVESATIFPNLVTI